MSWAEIKKSVNSTLGTAGAMPLDEIVKQEANNLKNGLKNGVLIPQKSEMLKDDWQDIELKVHGDDPYGFYKINRLESGLYVARISIEFGGIPAEEPPMFAFLFYVERKQLTSATIYSRGEESGGFDYDAMANPYDSIDAYVIINGKYYQAGINNFKVKKII